MGRVREVTKIDVHGKKSSRLSLSLINKLVSIVEDVRSGVKTRNQAICSLLSMEGSVTNNEFKIIKSAANLIDKPPNDLIMEEIREHELCNRYIDPLLGGLFDDPANGVLFRWTDQATLESKKSSVVSRRRPDSCITKLNGVRWDRAFVFGEVKWPVKVKTCMEPAKICFD
ncbi:unnamed protein product [Absidia cylindrospora]